MGAPLGISHIRHEPYETWATITCSGESPTQAANSGNIVAGIHQHNPISSRGQQCQDASAATAQFQPRNATHRECSWHLSGTWHEADEQPGSRFRYAVDNFSNITNSVTQRPGKLIA
jgi:hypothetical protein